MNTPSTSTHDKYCIVLGSPVAGGVGSSRAPLLVDIMVGPVSLPGAESEVGLCPQASLHLSVPLSNGRLKISLLCWTQQGNIFKTA